MRLMNLWINALFATGIALGSIPALGQPSKPRSLYDGATVEFAQANFIKPRERAQNARAYKLAPLIVQEVTTNKGGDPTALQPKRIYFHSGSVDFNGQAHQQMTYWWTYDESPLVTRPAQTHRGPDVRRLKHEVTNTNTTVYGVRLTMGSNGIPVIYELLGGESDIRQIFVTQSVEALAQANYGYPVPGRRHAVEVSLDAAPKVVVARVIDDPPAEMGPILYLRANTHAVATLICRCMNSQAKTLVGQGLYTLVPRPDFDNTSDATRLEAAIPRWLREDFSNQTNRLSRSLRLPGNF
jgi:hypothetical protein